MRVSKAFETEGEESEIRLNAVSIEGEVYRVSHANETADFLNVARPLATLMKLRLSFHVACDPKLLELSLAIVFFVVVCGIFI